MSANRSTEGTGTHNETQILNVNKGILAFVFKIYSYYFKLCAGICVLCVCVLACAHMPVAT